MPFPELLQTSTKWLLWSGIAFTVITLISFLVRWKQSFRLIGISSFTLLLAASSWAFSASYTPRKAIEGGLYLPVVFDNGEDLVIAQAPIDFPETAISPTLEQLAENLQGRKRNGGEVTVRIRKLESVSPGISRPVVLGEITQDLKRNTRSIVLSQNPENLQASEPPLDQNAENLQASKPPLDQNAENLQASEPPLEDQDGNQA